MSSKSKYYTPVECKILLSLISKYKNMIEAKQSNASTLKDKKAAWEKVVEQYNNSKEVVNTRTMEQLKKMWTNLKYAQLEALTHEKQSCMATGGGPPLPPAEVDPEIAMIVPHLMEAAPTNFSSNILVEDEDDYVNKIVQEGDNRGTTLEKYLGEELLGDQEVQDDGCPPDPSNIPTSEVTDSGIPAETPAKPARTAVNRRRSSIAIESSSKERISRDSEKVQRIAVLRKQDKLLFEIKKNHEMKVAKMKECHLNVIQELQQQHMAEIQELELRKATAETELAELRLAREKDYA